MHKNFLCFFCRLRKSVEICRSTCSERIYKIFLLTFSSSLRSDCFRVINLFFNYQPVLVFSGSYKMQINYRNKLRRLRLSQQRLVSFKECLWSAVNLEAILFVVLLVIKNSRARILSRWRNDKFLIAKVVEKELLANVSRTLSRLQKWCN